MHNPVIHAENRKYTLGQLLDQQVAADAPTRMIRDFLPDGTPYIVLVATGHSALVMNEVFQTLQAGAASSEIQEDQCN